MVNYIVEAFARFRRDHGLAYCLWKLGDHRRAIAHSRTAAQHAGDAGLLRFRAMALELLAQIEPREARELRGRARRIAAELDALPCYPRLAMNEGLFRDQRHECPACKTMMRAYGARLVCDHCGGMQLDVGDLTRSSEDVALAPVVVRFVDHGAASNCPHCATAMTACRVEIDVDGKTLRPPIELSRCEAHGPFFPAATLGEFFTAVERRMHAGQIKGSH